MLTRHVLLSLAAALSCAAPALAGEGNGDPFPGPDAVIREQVQKPNYTMGSDAPFNHFYTPMPTPMTGYHAAAGASQDPYPFKAGGQMIQTQPPPRSTIVTGPSAGSHG